MTPEQRWVSMNCYASRHAVTVVGDRNRDLDSPRKTPVRSVIQYDYFVRNRTLRLSRLQSHYERI